MKRFPTLPILALSCLLLVAGVAGAQDERPFSYLVAAQLGWAVTPEVFTDYYGMGYGLTLGVEYAVAPNWALQGFLDYKAHSPDEGMIRDWYDDEGEYPGATDIQVSEGSLGAFTIGFAGKGKLRTAGSTTYPYLRGGFGITIAGADEVRVDYNDRDGDPRTNWHAGAGNETNVSVLVALGLELERSGGSLRSFFVEAGLHTIMQEGESPAIAFLGVGLTM